MPFSGKAISLDEQLSLLEQYGISIKDKKTARSCLTFIGYQRLFSYVKPFLQNSHTQITFEYIWNLYTFDRKLRLLVIDAIERIEVAFRVSISETMSRQYSPFWYTQDKHFKQLKWHDEFMEKVLMLTSRREHNRIKQFYNTYSSPAFPPSWVITECLTFGTWSKIFDNLKRRRDKIIVADRLNMRMMNLLSWIKCLTELRNLCAHHERIWDHIFRYVPRNAPDQSHQIHHFYQQAYVLIEMLKAISPQSRWKDRFKTLMEEYEHLPLEKMGFLSNWKFDPIWKSPNVLLSTHCIENVIN